MFIYLVTGKKKKKGAERPWEIFIGTDESLPSKSQCNQSGHHIEIKLETEKATAFLVF